MRQLSFVSAVVLCLPLVTGAQGRDKAPETFSANAQVVRSGQGAAATYVNIHVDKYSRDEDRDRLLKEFSTGGAAALSAALRKMPAVGYVEVGKKQWPVHFVRQQESANGGRSIMAVVGEPMFFVGGGAVDAKPREGFDLAVVQFTVDGAGLGKGSLAAAARVKAGSGPAGLELQDYAQEPVELITVRRLIK